MRKKAVKTHDVKIKYREPLCEYCGCIHFGCKCDGYTDDCENYKPFDDAVDDFSCKNIAYPISSFEIIRAEEMLFEKRTEPPLDFTFTLEIDGRDFSQCIVEYLEVDGKILIDESEDADK